MRQGLEIEEQTARRDRNLLITYLVPRLAVTGKRLQLILFHRQTLKGIRTRYEIRATGSHTKAETAIATITFRP